MIFLNLLEGTAESMKLLFMNAAHRDDVMGNQFALNLRVPGFKPQSENYHIYGRKPNLRWDLCLLICQGWDLVKWCLGTGIAHLIEQPGHGLDDHGTAIQFPTGAGNFLLHCTVQLGRGACPASCLLGTSGSFPGHSMWGMEADHPSPCTVEVNYTWGYTSTPLICLHSVVLN